MARPRRSRTGRRAGRILPRASSRVLPQHQHHELPRPGRSHARSRHSGDGDPRCPVEGDEGDPRADGAALQLCGPRVGQHRADPQPGPAHGGGLSGRDQRRTLSGEPRLPELVARAHRGPLPKLRYRRHHVVQRASEPSGPTCVRVGAGVFLHALPGEHGRCRDRSRGGPASVRGASPLLPRSARGGPLHGRCLHHGAPGSARQPRVPAARAALGQAQQGPRP